MLYEVITISLISYVLTKVAVTVYAGGLVFQQVFGIETMWGIDFFWISAIGLVLLTAIYTVIGGMKSVLYTSVLQTPILLLGSIIIVYLGLKEVGGWEEVIRITSYNVCYTKLLRYRIGIDCFRILCVYPGCRIWLLRFPECCVNFCNWCCDTSGVITSYSIHYTKLYDLAIAGTLIKTPGFISLIFFGIFFSVSMGVEPTSSDATLAPKCIKQYRQAVFV